MGMIFTSGVYYVTYEWLKDLARASVNDDGELVDGGADMSGGGMCGYVSSQCWCTVLCRHCGFSLKTGAFRRFLLLSNTLPQ